MSSLLSEHRLGVFRFANEAPDAQPGGPGVGHLQSSCVLALVELTPQGANAAWRAGLVARDRGAPLHLVCAHCDARGEHMVQHLARQIRQRLHVAARASCVAGGLKEHVLGIADRPSLLVLPWRRGNVLVEAVLGTLPERIYRSLFIPMLVVRRPALASYRRALVPVKLDANAAMLIAAARNVSRHARIRVLHVLDTGQEISLRAADTVERAIRLQRQRRSRTAYDALNEIITGAGAHERDAAALVSFGHVSARVLETARAGHAQLIAVGKHRRSVLSELFLEDLTHRLLHDADADLLMLPVEEGGRTVQPDAFEYP